MPICRIGPVVGIGQVVGPTLVVSPTYLNITVQQTDRLLAYSGCSPRSDAPEEIAI